MNTPHEIEDREPESGTSPTAFYFISDLHIGGDEALGTCDFEAELVAFLHMIATRPEPTELVINGDAFGLWEFTDIEGLQKLETLIGQFPTIFEAFRKAGEGISITLLPGNHDYEIACYPEFVDVLKDYNIDLARTVEITRTVAGRTIWIEHGNQYDAFNRMPDFGNPYAQPIGYFITSNMVSGAGKRSAKSRTNWLKDIQSVYPTEQIPYWVLSNYFYREMSPLLRWILVPFLLLLSVTLVVMAGAGLESLGITKTNVFLDNRLFGALGYFGSLVQLVLTVNASILTMMAALAVPLWLLSRDVRRTLKRFHVLEESEDLAAIKETDYIDAAREIFARDPQVAVFVYGHTHAPSVRRVEDRAIVNTGTWLKRLEHVPVRFGRLPGVFVPSFNLNYFRIAAEDGRIVIDYHKIDKAPPRELNLLQRLLMSRRPRAATEAIPARTLLDA